MRVLFRFFKLLLFVSIFSNILEAQDYIHRLAKLETLPYAEIFRKYVPKLVSKTISETPESLKIVASAYTSSRIYDSIYNSALCSKYLFAQVFNKNLTKACWAPEILACSTMGTGKKKTTPLYKAVSTQDEALLEELLRLGADPNKYNPKAKEDYPLISAVNKDNKAIVELLLKAGADPNLPGRERERTALFYARSPEVAQLLLEYKADSNHRDSNNRTPLDVLLNNKLFSVAHVLKQAGGLTSRELA